MANGITNLRSPIDERLSQVFTPSPDSKKVTGAESMTESIARGTRAEQALPDVMRMTSEAERAAVGEVGRERVQGAERLGGLGREQAKGIAELEQKYQELRPKPIEFMPSQENIGDLQNIMAQMVLIGGLVGGASKRSGIAGLKAIKGMLDGYKQGRKDIFDKEKLIYEKALETQRNELTMLKDLFESQNRARVAGNTAEMNALQAELNARTLNGAANIELVRGDNKRFTDQLTYAINAKDKAATLQEQIRSREEQAKAARAAQEAARQQSLANQLMLRQLDLQNKPVQLPSDLAKTYENIGETAQATRRTVSTFKPEFFGVAPNATVARTFMSLVERGLPAGEIASSVGAAFGANLPKITPQTVDWWKNYDAFVAQVRNKLFGATLTSREQADFEKFTISPATSPEQAAMFFQRQVDIINGARERERTKGLTRRVSPDVIDAYLGETLSFSQPGQSGQTPRGKGTPDDPIRLD